MTDNLPNPYATGNQDNSPNTDGVHNTFDALVKEQRELSSLKTPRPSQHVMSVGGYISWAVVTLAAGLLIAMIAIQQLYAVNEIGGDATSGDLMQVEITAKTLVGQDNLGSIANPQQGEETAVMIPPELDGGCYEQRLCYAVLLNELESADKALTYLDELDDKVEEHDLALTENQIQIRSSLGSLFEQYINGDMDSQFLPAAERELLTERLGYCGELALIPKGTPMEDERKEFVSTSVLKIMGMGLAMIIGCLIGIAGIAMAIMFAVFYRRGRMQSGLGFTATNHNYYIETFAIWIVMFFGSSLMMGFFIQDASTQMFAQPIVFFGSLLCLAWPVIRGVTFAQVRKDIGWSSEEPIFDLLFSPLTYAATLPMLIPGVIVVMLASMLVGFVQDPHEFARSASPGHPIQEYISSGDWLLIGMVFITACIAAPVVEETVFRGVLYRHLRDASSRWRIATSVLFSAALNGFVFAAIHPQGLLAVPVLMTLAICFSLAREWRGNLIAPMAMHAMHNSAITCLSLLVL